MPEPSGWFFDSVTFSNFALSAGLPILVARYGKRGFVTTQVADELTQGVAAGYEPLVDVLSLVNRGILQATSLDRDERMTFRQLVTHLGEGEAGSIAAAHHRHGIVVTDDLAARRTCADMNLPVTGTIGILRAAVRDHEVTPSAANDLLQKMVEEGFHSTVDKITRALAGHTTHC